MLGFVRNIKVTQTPKVLYEKILSQFPQHEYQTRHATEGRFILQKVKTRVIQKTVMYRAMVMWNSLPVHIIQVNTKERFKMLLKQYLKIS